MAILTCAKQSDSLHALHAGITIQLEELLLRLRIQRRRLCRPLSESSPAAWPAAPRDRLWDRQGGAGAIGCPCRDGCILCDEDDAIVPGWRRRHWLPFALAFPAPPGRLLGRAGRAALFL